MHYDFIPQGVCARAIHIDLDETGQTIQNVTFDGGCPGNALAVGKLIAGRPVDEIVELLAGNTCGSRPTSCTDQMSIALREAQALAANAG